MPAFVLIGDPNKKRAPRNTGAREASEDMPQAVNWRIKLPGFWQIIWQSLANYLAICFLSCQNPYHRSPVNSKLSSNFGFGISLRKQLFDLCLVSCSTA